MKKKIAALAMTAMLITTTLLAGCGSGGDTKDSGSGNTSQNTSQSSSDKGGGEGSSEGGEPYTVTLVLNGSQQKDEERIEEKINEILVPAINAKLDIVVLPWGSAAQQLQLMLAGDEKIDVFYTNATSALQYMNSGQILDMTQLIENYGKNLKEIFGDALSANKINDFTFGVPTQIERGSIPAIFMRKDIVEKYNIDTAAIKQPSDLEGVFEKVKAGEPNMTMLYSIGEGDTPVTRLLRADTLGDTAIKGAVMDSVNSTTVENYYASDWYMETTSMLYDWYQKGYISKDAATETENWRTVFKTGNLFSILFSYHPGTPVEFQSSTDCEFEIVPFYDAPLMQSSTYAGVIFSIAQNSENPEKAMECLDYIYGSPEVMNLLNWGEEGVDYVFSDEEKGIITYPEGVTADTVGYSLNLGWELPNQFIAHLWEGSDPDLWKNMEEFNAGAEKSKALGFVFDTTGYETQIASVTNVVTQYGKSLNSGSVDPKEYIPQFLKDLEAAGIDDIIKAKQEQLDAWLASRQ